MLKLNLAPKIIIEDNTPETMPKEDSASLQNITHQNAGGRRRWVRTDNNLMPCHAAEEDDDQQRETRLVNQKKLNIKT